MLVRDHSKKCQAINEEIEKTLGETKQQIKKFRTEESNKL